MDVFVDLRALELIEAVALAHAHPIRRIVDGLPEGHPVRDLLEGPHGWIGGIEGVREFYQLFLDVCEDRLRQARVKGFLRRPEGLPARELETTRDWLAETFPYDIIVGGRRRNLFILFADSLHAVLNGPHVPHFTDRPAACRAHYTTALSMLHAIRSLTEAS